MTLPLTLPAPRALTVRVLCALLLVLAIANWVGWATDTAILTTLHPAWVPMRPWTALWIGLLASALLLQTATTARADRAARALAVIVAVTAALVLLEYLGADFPGLDTLWLGDAVRRSPLPLPGRPSQQTALPMLLLALAVALGRTQHPRGGVVRLGLVGFATFIPLVVMLASVIRISGLLDFRADVVIAPVTAMALLTLATALVLLHPEEPPVSWFRSQPDRASLLRLFIVVVGFPIFVGGSELILVGLGATEVTALLAAGAFSALLVGLGVYVVSREEQRLLRERVELVDELARTSERYRLLAENASDLVFSTDGHLTIDWVSPSVTTQLGFTVDALIGTQAPELVHPDDLARLEALRERAMSGEPLAMRARLRRSNGNYRWGEMSIRTLLEDGKLRGTVAGVRDIDDEMAAQQAFQHEIEFDSLTGLPRREVALRRIQDVLDERAGSGWAILCLGVSGMTQINQAYTYHAGDAVLRAVAERLVAAVGAHDRVARIAGDEFVVIEPDLVTATGAASAADRILQAVRGPVTVQDANVEVSACIGIAISTDEDAEELLRDATAAMRQANLKGTNRWEFLDGNVGAHTRNSLRVQGELRDALSAGEIEAWFMPIVALPSGQVAGYEALARWHRSDGSVWGPDLFLDIAERTGLIVELDRAMFLRVLEAARTAPSDRHFAYNVSAASLASDGYAAWVREQLERFDMDPHRLKFEITETALLHVTSGLAHTVQSLAAVGIEWWVDDFGTGFSSISHLRDLPITGLKLDRSFTADLDGGDSAAASLAEGLLGLARGLHLDAIAEGVETAAQEARLVAQGWPYAQGWRYGKPLPPQW